MTDNLFPFRKDHERGERINTTSSLDPRNALTQSPMIKRKKQLKALDQTFYIRLLQIEEHISKKNITKEIINEVVGLYAKCVEYYDSVFDPIKVYFLEKIQITLSSLESLKVIYSSDKQEDLSDLKRKQETQNNKQQNSNITQKNSSQISKFKSNNSLQISKYNSVESSQSTSNNLSSIRNKNNSREPAPINQFENIKIRDFSTIETPIIENRCRSNESFDNIYIQKYLSKSSKKETSSNIKESSLNQPELKLNPFNFDEEKQGVQRDQINNEIQNNTVSQNNSPQHSLVSFQSSLIQQSPIKLNQNVDQHNDQQNQSNISQNKVTFESFIEEEENNLSQQRIRFTMNPNTLLQFDLNISDLNVENDISNTSNHSRIEMNVQNIVGDINYRDNNSTKNMLIEHGKSIFNKNISRQQNNLLKICNQTSNDKKDNQIIVEDTKSSQIENQNSSLTECLTSISSNTERNILGVRKHQINKSEINYNQLKYGFNCKQQAINLDEYWLNYLINYIFNQQELLEKIAQRKQRSIQVLIQKQQRKPFTSQQMIQGFSQIQNNLSEYSIQQKKLERAKRFSMFMTMQNEKKQSAIKQNFNKILNRFEQDSEQKDQIVKLDIDNQVEIIKQRLENRKSKSIKERVIKDIQSRKDNIQTYSKENGNILNSSPSSKS